MDFSVIKFSVVEFESNCIVFLYCFVGSLTTDQFHRFGDISYEFEWYQLPIDLQKYLTLIIADAQRPQVFTGFNIIDSSLMTFTKVCLEQDIEESESRLLFESKQFDFQITKTVVSYYMMFKRLAN